MIRHASRISIAVGATAVFAATVVAAGLFSRDMPADLDLSLARPTDHGLYIAEIAPVDPLVSIGVMHAWTTTIRSADGRPLDDVTVAINGGMPQHGHGLPTAPEVTQSLGDGVLLIEGMKFNMPGWWEIDLVIDGPVGDDTITFNLVL